MERALKCSWIKSDITFGQRASPEFSNRRKALPFGIAILLLPHWVTGLFESLVNCLGAAGGYGQGNIMAYDWEVVSWELW